MLYKVIFLILIIFFSCFVIANEVDIVNNTDSLTIETAYNNIRNFDEAQLNEYKTQKEFQYNIGKEGNNRFWEYLKSWLVKFLDWLFGGAKETNYNWELAGSIIQFLKTAFWIAAILLLIYGVLKMLGLDFASLFYKTADVKPLIKFETIEEDIHEIDFDKEIEQAIVNKNYRYAIRLYYLKTLKILSDKELINWQKDKTNADYVFEVSKTGLSTDFRKITKLFNYSWYGEVVLNTNTFNMAQQNFTTFFNQLNQHNA